MKINNLVEKIIGYILLSPTFFSLFLIFFEVRYRFFDKFTPYDEKKERLFDLWFGIVYKQPFRAGFSLDPEVQGYSLGIPNTAIFFGLMALAGVYLIKDNKK